MTIKTPTTSQYTIPAGDRKQIGAAGNFIACIEGTDLFHLSLNGGGEFLFGSGLYYKCPEFTEYHQIDIINKTANPLTVTVVWGFGDFQDKRLTASGILQVGNPAGQKLDVDDADTQVKLDAVIAAVQAASLATISALADKTAKRTPLTTLQGAAYAEAAGTTLTVVPSGTNVNGVVIRLAGIGGYNVAECYVRAGGNAIIETSNISSYGGLIATVKDIFVPPGVAITMKSMSSVAKSWVWYEVL